MTTNELVIYMLGGLGGIIFATVFFRFIFMIPTIVRNLKAQRELLSMIAKNQGCEVDRIESINNVADAGFFG